MTMQPGASAVEKVPVEVWLKIFQQVPKSTDLYGLSLASRHFSSIATRALHRDLVWEKEWQAANNLDVWKTDAGMASRVRSLVLGIGGEPPNNTPEQNAAILNSYIWPSVLDRHTPAGRRALLTSSRPILFTPQHVLAVLWVRVETFTNLSSLVLKNMNISNAHFRLIHSLVQLRSLSLIGCIVDADAVDGFNNQTLPITELTMISVARGRRPTVEAYPHHIQVALNPANPPPFVPDSYANTLSLATATNLRTLKVDSSTDVFRHVFGSPEAANRGWVAPPMLEHLYVLQRRTIIAPEPRRQRWHDDDDFESSSLYDFCAQAHSLKTISAPSFAPSRVTVDHTKLPPHLESFAAPLDTAQFVAAYRDVKALGVLKCGLATPEAIEALALIAAARPGLEVLVFEVKTWDTEIMAAIAWHFKQLRRLKLVYGNGGPTENYLANLGAEILVQLPELRTLEMYKLPPNGGYTPEHPTHLFDNTWGSIEEEMRDIIIPWNHWCPKLRRVQLVSGYAMTRGFEGAVWKMEELRRLGRIEYLDY